MARPTRALTVATVAAPPPLTWGEDERRRIEEKWGDQFSPTAWVSMVGLVHGYQHRVARERNAPRASVLADHLSASGLHVAALLEGFKAAARADVAEAMWAHLDELTTSGEARTGDMRGKTAADFPALRLSSRELVKELLALRSALETLAAVYGKDAPDLLVTRSGEAWEEFVRQLNEWATEHGYPVGVTHNETMLPFMRLIEAIGELLPPDTRPTLRSPSALGKAIEKALDGGK